MKDSAELPQNVARMEENSGPSAYAGPLGTSFTAWMRVRIQPASILRRKPGTSPAQDDKYHQADTRNNEFVGAPATLWVPAPMSQKRHGRLTGVVSEVVGNADDRVIQVVVAVGAQRVLSEAGGLQNDAAVFYADVPAWA